MSTTETAAAQADTITLTGRALENAQPGHPSQRQTVFEVARAVRGRATSEIEKAIVGIAAAESIDFGHRAPASQAGVRDAYRDLAGALNRMDVAIDTAARTSAAAAENNDLYKDGRADRIDGALHEADGAIEDAGATVGGAAEVLRATLEEAALPAVPSDPTPTLSTLTALMNAAADGDKPQLFDRLASRDDHVGGWLLSDLGLEYARASFGREAGEARHRSARLRALQAALERGDRHAVAVRAVSDLMSASGAYKAAWRSVRGNLVALSNDLREQAAPQE